MFAFPLTCDLPIKLESTHADTFIIYTCIYRNQTKLSFLTSLLHAVLVLANKSYDGEKQIQFIEESDKAGIVYISNTIIEVVDKYEIEHIQHGSVCDVSCSNENQGTEYKESKLKHTNGRAEGKEKKEILKSKKVENSFKAHDRLMGAAALISALTSQIKNKKFVSFLDTILP